MNLKEALTSALLIPFYIVYAFGGIIGVAYWASEGEPLDAVLSLIIPFYGAISVAFDIL